MVAAMAAPVPVIEGEWWSVAGPPELGEWDSEEAQVVDFGIWRADDGKWQIWSCIRKTADIGKTRLFHRWEGGSLEDRDWPAMGVVMRAEPALGETGGGMQAPHVVEIDGIHHMLYGDWQNICLATSADGKAFERRPVRGISGRFGEGPQANARDAMMLEIDGLWHVYYTAHPDMVGRVLCRTTRDFERWSEPTLVRIGGEAGHDFWSHECPHVVEKDGWFFLFTTQDYGEDNITSVFRSRDPLHFGIEDDSKKVAELAVAAPEIVEHEGQLYIAALKPGLDGIRLAKLGWTEDGQGAAVEGEGVEGRVLRVVLTSDEVRIEGVPAGDEVALERLREALAGRAAPSVRVEADPNLPAERVLWLLDQLGEELGVADVKIALTTGED